MSMVRHNNGAVKRESLAIAPDKLEALWLLLLEARSSDDELRKLRRWLCNRSESVGGGGILVNAIHGKPGVSRKPCTREDARAYIASLSPELKQPCVFMRHF